MGSSSTTTGGAGGQHDGQGQAEALALGQVAGVGLGVDAGHDRARAVAAVVPGVEVARRGRWPGTRRPPSRRSAGVPASWGTMPISRMAVGRAQPRAARDRRARPCPTAAPAARPGAPSRVDLPGAVATHDRQHLAGAHLDGRRRAAPPPARRRRAGPTPRPRRPSRPPVVETGGVETARGRGGQGLAQRAGRPAGVADRQRQRRPAGQPAELDHRRRHRRGGHDRGRVARPRPGRRRRAACRIRSAYCTTRSRRCSATSTVMPRSWTSRVSAASTSSAAAGSSAEVGSSSTSTRGEAVSTEPMATRCCWPPDSVTSGRSRSSCRPSRSSVSSTRRRMTSGGHAQVLHGVGQLVLDGVGDEAGGRVLPDDADQVGQVAGRVVLGAAAVHRHRPRSAGRR